MDFIFYHIALIFAAGFWGYFDQITNICFRIKMEVYEENHKIDENESQKKIMSKFFENDRDFKIASFIKITSFISSFVAIFYISFIESLILLVFFFIGRIIPLYTNVIEKIYNEKELKSSVSKLIEYSNIYYLFFTFYFISVIITS